MGFQSWVVHEKGVCKLEDEGIKVGGQGWEGFPQSCFEEENVESKESIAVDINTNWGGQHVEVNFLPLASTFLITT